MTTEKQKYGAGYEKVQEQRALYMDGKLSHQDYYLWLAEFIGATEAMIPASDKALLASSDPHLNDIPLGYWDGKDMIVRECARRADVRAWSLSDTVCVLKALARRKIERLKKAGE